MKFYLFIVFFVVLISCNKNQDKSNNSLELIKSSNVTLFEDVSIEARKIVEGKHISPFFKKYKNGKEYLLPNFEYYGCNIELVNCLKENTNKKFDIISYATSKGKDSLTAYDFVNEYSKTVNTEFEKLNIKSIVSKPNIGECVIYFINEKEYVAYVPDINMVKNTNWRNRFNKKKPIDNFWYQGEY
ncbi:hypothetical protein [Pseudofulvibacter geojedonensis]|uniref:Lipoprotein n=1 Tax=Pseudofulvibacter geojedonensis TaxID=1123758 RepID=A0ABW3I0T5_9FLAO